MKLTINDKSCEIYWKYEYQPTDIIDRAECHIIIPENDMDSYKDTIEITGISKRHNDDHSNKEFARKLSFWRACKQLETCDKDLAHGFIRWFFNCRKTRQYDAAELNIDDWLVAKKSGQPSRYFYK